MKISPMMMILAALATPFVDAGTTNTSKGSGGNSTIPMITASWKSVVPLNTARNALAAGVIGTKIIVAGGGAADYSPMAGKGLASAEMFDGNKWSNINPMKTTRRGPAATVHNNKMYVMGGSLDYGDVPMATGEVYDMSTKNWTDMVPMRTPRQYFGAATVGDMIYVAGSYPSYDGTQGCLSSAEVFNVTSQTWADIPSMNNERLLGGTMPVLHNKIYAIGGRNCDYEYDPTAEVFDPQTQTWKFIASLTYSRVNPTSVVMNGKIYVVGGCNTNLEIYEPQSNTWTTGTSLQSAEQEQGGVVLKGFFYVIGGGNNGGASTNVAAFGAWHECNKAAGCDVCGACCNDYIQDGAQCEACVTSQCNDILPRECNPAAKGGCNVCDACCEPFITDDNQCSKCFVEKCR